MSGPAGVRLYRHALRCYPRGFREEYGADMVALLEDQLRDEQPVRVWSRLVLDLVVTIPTRHLEVHMNRPPNFVLPALFGGLATAGALVLVVGGVGGATLATGAILTLLSAALAFLFWRDTRRGATTTGAGDRWWKFLTAGVVALGTFVVVTTVRGEVTEGEWAFGMLALLVGLGLLSTGLILGVARLAGGRQH